MRTVMFGELEVSAIGLGCMSMTDSYGPADRNEAARTLERAVELGVTLFDTANAYGAGENELLVGAALAPHRDEVVIATKFGFVVDGRTPRIDGHPDRVEDRCNESLDRLGVDHIDLYFLHRLDPDVPIEETVGAMARLIDVGKVRHLGLSEVNTDTLRRAHATRRISAVQSEYSLWTRDPEGGVLDACRQLGIGFMPYSPLGRAMLAGAITNEAQVTGTGDLRSTLPRFQGEHLANNLVLVDDLKALAESLAVTPAQLSLAWVLSRAENIAPIPGTRRRKWLEQNVQAVDLQLDEATTVALDELFAPNRVSGGRYNLSWMRSSDSSTSDD
ncbi:MAG: aldo/keto reductase [Acidimicrobiales bacterium]|nr:aldo/keto reductase [Acidimicrobiales bacterium]MYG88936.1 aldo/keto reductase [Acidimicrobiales bacterium]MYI28602.1 aldo/keto reductase [Acidimicrobiales bacterium]